jgi:transcriptional regulator with XRE-family HTH domain
MPTKNAKPLSRAVRLLEKKLHPELTQTELARQLGVKKQNVSQWMSGWARPTPERMKALQDLLGIPMEAWTQPADADDAPSGTLPTADAPKPTGSDQ